MINRGGPRPPFYLKRGIEMKKLGMITIGQAPRADIAPFIEKYLDGRAELIQVGALDGMSKEYIEQSLSPGKGDYVLTSRLRYHVP